MATLPISSYSLRRRSSCQLESPFPTTRQPIRRPRRIAVENIAIALEQPTRLVSAGMNRHGVTNVRVVKKGIANHLESESCEGDRKATLEALTGAYAGRASSSEIGSSESRRCQPYRKTTRRRTPRRVR